jgi:hypothetical protein
LQVPEAFLPLLNSIKGAYQRACGSALLGVYVRGSLPKGTFLPGVSDVDTFALVLVEDEGGSSSSSKQQRHARYAPVKEQQLSRLRGEIQDLLVTTEQHFRRLDYTKLEIRLLPLPMSHPAAQTLLAATAELPASAPIPDDVGLTPSMVRELPAAFTLATQSVALWGWELPQQLPRAAAVPATLDLLPGLVDDVAMALDAAAAAEAAGDMAKQGEFACISRLSLQHFVAWVLAVPPKTVHARAVRYVLSWVGTQSLTAAHLACAYAVYLTSMHARLHT